jgi:hypothetical protein
MFSPRHQPAVRLPPLCCSLRLSFLGRRMHSLWCRSEGLNTRLYRSSQRNQLSGSAERFLPTATRCRAVCRSGDLSTLSQWCSALDERPTPTAPLSAALQSDLNPIENAFAKLKEHVRFASAA